MTCILRALIAALCLLLPVAAFGQGAVLQSGPKTPGHVPQYVGTGPQAIVQDGGGAAGGGIGANPAEFGLTARGTGTPPYVGQGSGPLGTIDCEYDAPKTNATGYHYLCFGPNPGQLVFGASSPAVPIPFTFNINGVLYTLPASGGGGGLAIFTAPSTVGVFPCWASTIGLLADCTIGAATLVGNPTSGSAKAAAFTIQGLAARGAPDANNDKLLIFDNAAGVYKYVTPGLIASSATAGVSSLGGITGPITLGNNMLMTGSVLSSPLGGSSGQIQYNNAGVAGGFTASGDVAIVPSTGVATIQPNVVTTGKIADANVTNAKLAPGPANTTKGSVNGTTTSDFAMASCSAAYQFTQWLTGTGWQCGINPVLPSRAVALTINLAAYSVVTTQGYAQPGDGGGAMIRNVGSAPFIDSYITNFTIAGGSGYTNGSYFGVIWQLPAGGKPWAIGTATVAGGVVTAVNISGTPGNLCHVGDVFTTPTLPAGSGASITVTGCSTPLASFTDTAGTHFQYVVDFGNFPNIKQFGCKGDWANSDGTATDNFNCIQAGLWYAGYNDTRDVGLGGGGWVGNTLITPQGSFMACGGATTSLVVPQGVYFRGVSTQASIVKMCDGFSSAQHFVTLGDNNWHSACLDNRIMDMQIAASRSVSSGAFLVYSRCLQDFGGVYNTYFYAGGRGCLWFERGDGGASTAYAMHVSCNIGSNGPAIRIGDSVASGLNFGSTIVKLTDIVVGGPSSAPFQASDGILIQGGIVTVEDIHCENVAGGCVVLDIPDDANKMSARLHNVNAGSGNPGGCLSAITLTGNNRPGNAAIGQVQPTSCTHVVSNGQSGGTSYDLPIVTDAKFSPNFTQP